MNRLESIATPTTWTQPVLAPRPFRQLASRNYRLGLPIPTGYVHSLTGAAWYRPYRRTCQHWLVYPQRAI